MAELPRMAGSGGVRKTDEYLIFQSCLRKSNGSSPQYLKGQSFNKEGSPL